MITTNIFILRILTKTITIMEKQLLGAMFDNLLHIWNKINYWNPRMKSYIYGSVNWVHVFDLTKTVKKLDEVKKLLEEASKNGKVILFVATKLQARDAFEKLAEETGNHYVSEKWVPGLLTNFKTIRKRIGTYIKLLKDFEMNAFDGYTKKEIAGKKLELEKLNTAYKGLKELKKVPDLVFVVDGVYEIQAIRECQRLGIDVVSISNTNGDDLVVQNLIPANTNSVKSLEFIATMLKPALANKRPQAGTNSLSPAPKTEMKITKVDGEKVSGAKKIVKEDSVETETEVAKEESSEA
jgi:small subunit ribosomal protein S2